MLIEVYNKILKERNKKFNIAKSSKKKVYKYRTKFNQKKN